MNATLESMALFFEAAVQFADGLENLYAEERFFEIESPNFQRCYCGLLDHLARFEELSQRFPPGDSDYSTNRRIHATVLSMLEGLAENPAFNKDEFDVAGYLERGRIVVIDLQELTERVVVRDISVAFPRLAGDADFAEHLPIGRLPPTTKWPNSPSQPAWGIFSTITSFLRCRCRALNRSI